MPRFNLPRRILFIVVIILIVFSWAFPTIFHDPVFFNGAYILVIAGVCCLALGFYRLKESNQKPESASGDLMPLMWFVLSLAFIAYVGVSAVMR